MINAGSMFTRIKIICCLISMLVCKNLFSQDIPKAYLDFVKKGDSLYKVKAYKASALAYHDAFLVLGRKGYPDDRYDAACSWALAGFPDSAFYNLQRIADKSSYANYSHLASDPDLISLQRDRRWPPLLTRVKHNRDSLLSQYDLALINQIDSMTAEDQKWRHLSTRSWNRELDTVLFPRAFLYKKMHETDSLNYSACRSILARRGFPNYNLVGKASCNNYWLLVQHQDLRPAFQDSVLAKMKPEVDLGLASGIDYAYLMDRVKINTGQQQVYGTQMRLNQEGTSYEPLPVIEPEKLNERRKAVGMGSIEKYIETMNTNYHGTLRK